MILLAALAILVVTIADLTAINGVQTSAQDERDAYELHELHARAQSAVYTEAVMYWRLHEGIGDPASHQLAVDERVFLIDHMQEDLERLSGAPGMNGTIAQDLQTTLARLPGPSTMYTSLFSLDNELLRPVEALSERIERQSSRGRSAGALTALARSPLMNVGVVVTAPRSDASEPTSAVLAVNLLDAGSWSSDPNLPFGSPGINRRAIEVGLPSVSGALAGIEQWPTTLSLHEVDLWLQELRGAAILGGDWPPAPALVLADLSEFFDLSLGLAGTLHTLTVDVFQDQIAANDVLLQRAERRVTVNLGVMAIALVVALVAAARLALLLRNRQDELRSLAATDALTGLGNRFVLQQSARRQLGRNTDHGLVHVDLDRFKQINDTFGHQAGDAVLVEVAQRIRRVTGDAGRAFRTGGDEFVVLCRGDNKVVAELAHRLCDALASEPVHYDGMDLEITASVGAVAHSGPVAYEDLMIDADLATYRAKVGARNQAVVMDENSSLGLVKRLDDAVANGEIVAWFQPEVDVHSGRVANFECLARWVSPSGEVVPSGEWIWTVEWMGATDLILEAVVKSIAQAQRTEVDFAGRYFINMDARLLASPGRGREILGLLEAHGVRADRTGLDVIGDIASQPLDQLSATVRELRDAGINIALDDFGAVSAPLSILSTLPVDTIKIDRSLVVNADTDPRKHALFEMAVATARALSADVLAEGIETTTEFELVRELGVDYVAGSFTGLATAAPMTGKASLPVASKQH